MNIKKIFLIVAAGALVACQPKNPNKNAENDNFRCIAVTLNVAGKMVPSVVEWNTRTGVTRIIDSTTYVSRTGAQNTAVGWVQVGDLQNAVQELIARDQAQQQTQQQAQQKAAMPTEASAPAKAAAAKVKK